MTNDSYDTTKGRTSVDIIVRELKSRKLAICAVIFSMLLASGVTLVQPLFFKMLFDTAIPEKNITLAGWLLLGMVATPIVAIGITYVQEHLRVYLGEHVSQAFRRRLFDRVIHYKFADIERITSSQITFRITRDAGRIGELYIAQELLPVISSSIMLLCTYGLMFLLNVKLALISAAALPATFFLTKYLVKHSRKLDRQLSSHLEIGEHYLNETFRGLRTIRAFGGERHEKSRWLNWINQHIQLKLRSAAFHQITLSFPNELITGLIVGLLFGYGAYEIMNDRMSIGSLIAFGAYAPRAYGSLRSVLNTFVGTKRVKVSMDRLDELFQHPAETISDTNSQPFPLASQSARIEFRNVFFQYARGFKVNDLTFDIKGGELFGVVGPTGGGKSTLIDLLLRFYDLERGSITIDGIDIKQISLESLRRNVVIIPQDIFLWNATIFENITYPLNDIDIETVEEVSRSAQLHDFVKRQPLQYETVLGEGGSTLSGGERQRIGIARALLRKPRILIMDEATSAVDAITEARLRDVVDEVRSGQTTIIIAHRLSTILRADRILVMDDGGRVTEIGEPRELLDRGGYFAKLYRAQELDLRE